MERFALILKMCGKERTLSGSAASASGDHTVRPECDANVLVLFVAETFRQPKLIPKHLTGSDVPNCESSASASDKEWPTTAAG